MYQRLVLVPDSFLILVNNSKQSLHARNSIEISHFEYHIKSLDYQEALRNLTLFLLLNPVLFSRQDYQK